MNVNQVNITSSAISSSSQMYNHDSINPSYTISSINKSAPISIPNNRQILDTSNHYTEGRSSVEDLNQEIEKLILEGLLLTNSIKGPTPEGHTAPLAKLLSCDYRHSFDTDDDCNIVESDEDSSQCGSYESGDSSNNVENKSHSSPAHFMMNNEYNPKINNFLLLEAPVGCEKVKIIKEEEKKRGNLSHLLITRCPQNLSNPGFVLLPSQSSAFLPLYKLRYSSDPFNKDLREN